MMLTRHHGGFIILLSFATALLLDIMPLSDGLRPYRPDWVALVLIFWCLALPDRVGVISGWLVGLLLDVLTGTLLGQHALSLCVVAYLCGRLHQQIRVFPLWQQALSVLIFLVIDQLLVLWINSITGRPGPGLSYWLPSLVGALLWPLLYSLLDGLRRGFAVR